MQTFDYEAIHHSRKSSERIEDTLAVEAALQININGEAYTVVMRTPGDDKELIRGLLYAEDIYKGFEPLDLKVIEQKENHFSIINVTILNEKLGKGYLNKRTLLSVSSCGVCGKRELNHLEVDGNALKNRHTLSMEDIETMHLTMKLQQSLFEATGGSHATAAFDKNGELVSIKEDIGRHNALDKVIGQLLNINQLNNISCIFVSGRVSYEIVSKAFIAKIPVIVAVSACTSLAVDFAKEFGICLIGFARNKKATIYSNPDYIKI